MSRNARADLRARRRRRDRYRRWETRRRRIWQQPRPLSPAELAAYHDRLVARMYAVMGLSSLAARGDRP